ncbi:MAG: O-antigen ligase family protein [Cyclobacteriaceae bacterium]|nr:O-antigen ligase family protein [Cyclobacteriaceae bacterium]
MMYRMSWQEIILQKYDFLFIVIIIFFLPFRNAFVNIVGVIYVIVVIGMILIKPCHYKFRYHALRQVFWMPLLFLIYFLSIFYSEEKAGWIHTIIVLLPFLILPIYFSYVNLSNDERTTILWSFVFGNLTSLIINLMVSLGRSLHLQNGSLYWNASVLGGQDFWFSIAQGGNYFFYDQFSRWIHPTYWAVYLFFSTTIVMETFYKQKGIMIKASKLALILIFVGGIFLCSSRIVLMSAIALVLIYLARLIFIEKPSRLAWVILSFLIVTSLFFAHPRFREFTNLNTAFSLNQIRLRAWNASLTLIEENPWLGYGAGDSESYLIERYHLFGYQEHYSNRYNEHNQILNIALATGLVGVLIFSFLFIDGFRRSLLNWNFIQFGFLFVILSVCMVENFLMRRAGVFYFSFFYCLLFIYDKPHLKIPPCLEQYNRKDIIADSH